LDLSLTVSSIEEAERIYALLSKGGQVFMPMQTTFFASGFAMRRDSFGTSWMILGRTPRNHRKRVTGIGRPRRRFERFLRDSATTRPSQRP